MLLVVTPTNVYKMESVCGDRRRVNSAVFGLAHPFGSEPEQVHPVLLRNALCESCDTGTCQCMDRRCLNDALPLLNMRVSTAVQKQIVSKREHVLSHLDIASENLLKVI